MQKFIFFLILTSLIQAKDPQLTEHTLPVYGNASLGYYYVKLYVGTPPQQQSVIIDTGSGQLALPCNKCTNCNPRHIDRPFDMQKSKTAEYITCESNDPQCKRCASKNPTQECRFMISYAEGSSLEGVIIKDVIQFESFSSAEGIEASFGCTVRQSNLFLKQEANGIFGLSPDRTSPLLQDMYRKHHLYSGEDLSFSLCLAGNGGQMTIGNVKSNLHTNNQSVKTTFSPHRNVYSLNNVGDIKVGQSFIHKKKQKFGIYGIFIDSGSTFTYFPRENFLTFKKELIHSCALNKQICQIASGQSVLCFHLKGTQDIGDMADQIFAPITIQIGSKVVEWKASKYFLLRDVANRQICLAVESLDRFLLGANWMVDRDIIFNLKQKTIQIFSQANCLNKQTEVRRMSQFSEDVQGHKPLNYQTSVENFIQSLKSSNILIVIGIILVMIGVVGVFILILRQRQNKIKVLHNPVSTIQTQDHIELGMNSSTNSSTD